MFKEAGIKEAFYLRYHSEAFRCFLFVLFSFFLITSNAQNSTRKEIPLNSGWLTVAADSSAGFAGFEQRGFNDRNWKPVNVPHNWDAYEGYRRMRHGNRHGTAWYRKTFS